MVVGSTGWDLQDETSPGPFPDIQFVTDVGVTNAPPTSAVLIALTLGTAARRAAVQAFVTGAIANHERTTLSARWRVFLHMERIAIAVGHMGGHGDCYPQLCRSVGSPSGQNRFGDFSGIKPFDNADLSAGLCVEEFGR